jgi:hypothetical protein
MVDKSIAMLSSISQLLELAKKSAELSAQHAEEVMNMRAWKSILHLFFVRYYLEHEDPLTLARSDRDFLTNCWKEQGHSEEVASQIDEIYSTIIQMVENQSLWAASSDPSEEPEPDLPM